MGRALAVLFLLWAVPAGAKSSQGAQIDPNLFSFIRGEAQASYVPVLAVMQWQQTPSSPKVYQSPEVIAYLRWQAHEGWRRVNDHLQLMFKDNASHIRPDQLFFLNNSFTALVTVEGLRRIAYAPGVSKIYLNYEMSFDDPFPSPDYSGELSQIPYNFKMIGMDRLIQEAPDVDGRGVILGAIDSGVDGNHPDLKGNVIFMYDAQTNSIVPPRDPVYHGTHVSGIVAGGDRTHRYIGVAPRTTLVMASAVTLEELLMSMHYMLDTDGNPTTYFDIPRAVNNSWTSFVAKGPFPLEFSGGLCGQGSQMPDQEPFYRAISAWEAVGIVPVFSAGNCGPNLRTITPPKEHPASITVGSLGPDGMVLPDSSRGPAHFQGRDTFKPDLMAPGHQILSTMPGGRYQKFSGTSMAAPHVTGTIAMMTQVNPALTPADIKDILIRTATPRSRNGGTGSYGQWTPEYGYGVLNAYEAVKAARSWGGSLLGATLPKSLFWPFSSLFKEAPKVKSNKSLWEALQFPEDLEGTKWIAAEELF